MSKLLLPAEFFDDRQIVGYGLDGFSVQFLHAHGRPHRDTPVVDGLQVCTDSRRLTVCRDFGSVRRLLRAFKASESFTELSLFGRRNPARMLEYCERRSRDRSLVRTPVTVTPGVLDDQHIEFLASDERTILAFARDVSLRGISFTHGEAFDGHHAVLTLDLDGESVVLLIEVRWSLSRGPVWISGGMFLGIAQ